MRRLDGIMWANYYLFFFLIQGSVMVIFFFFLLVLCYGVGGGGVCSELSWLWRERGLKERHDN